MKVVQTAQIDPTQSWARGKNWQEEVLQTIYYRHREDDLESIGVELQIIFQVKANQLWQVVAIRFCLLKDLAWREAWEHSGEQVRIDLMNRINVVKLDWINDLQGEEEGKVLHEQV